MFKILFPLLITSLSYAGTLQVVSSPYNYQEAIEFQALMANLKTYGEFSAKDIPQDVKPVEKTMSRGQQMVEEAKAKNRAILAEKNRQDKAQAESDSSSTMTDLQKWKAEEKKNLDAWKKESKDQLNAWKKEQEIFLGRIKVYKENTFAMPVKVETIVEKKIPAESVPNIYIINATFAVPIRDQSARPTCVAFAGVRAIETILAQNKQVRNLSEQYLYWSGKPNCQTAPCSSKGSWVIPAYQYSQKHADVDIPLEENCAYNGSTVPQNETQIPLAQSCSMGSTKVMSFEEVITISEVVDKIQEDIPVIVAARLSENFYRNKGLITLADSEKKTGAKLDGHALGHAFLAVGLMELPEKLKATEGNFCIVVANSWGKGWGTGGYSCMTEKWFEKYRQPSPFVAVTKISTK